MKTTITQLLALFVVVCLMLGGADAQQFPDQCEVDADCVLALEMCCGLFIGFDTTSTFQYKVCRHISDNAKVISIGLSNGIFACYDLALEATVDREVIA